MIEIWEPIKGYEGFYIVSNLGRVMSTNKTVESWNGLKLRKGKVLKSSLTKKGYVRISLSKFGDKTNFFVHRLVAEMFIENLFNLPEVNHKDGNKSNNVSTNLEWVTKPENHIHAKETGLKAKGEKHGNSKLTNNDVLEIKNLLSKNISYGNIAKQFNVTRQNIYAIKQKLTWT